ncbi:MAG: glycosyltransferase [Acetivibrionales bacterium]|jgi:glycosyltransferase involved in cell wall biosynthesis/cyclopropane fatty-acyl-phospholipid synthase-like methyltransferase
MINQYDVPLQLNNINPLTVIISYITPGIEILEMGSASGRLTRYLTEEMGCRVSIVEIDTPSYKKAMKFAADGICANLDKDEWYDYYSKKKFDAIIFADVIEHLNRPKEVINSAKSLLKKDGKMLFSVPNIAYNGILAQLLNNNFNYTETGILDNTHIKFYTYYSFHKLLDECGMFVFSEKAIHQDINTGDWSDFKSLNSDTQRLLRSREFSDVYEYIFAAVTTEWQQANKNQLNIDRMVNYKGATAVSTLYFDYGDGFKPQNYLQSEMLINSEGKFLVSFDLRELENVKKFRFDPCEYECKIKILSVNGKAPQEVDPLNNYIMKQDKIYFFTKDPTFIITNPTFIKTPIMEIIGQIGNLTSDDFIAIIDELKTDLNEKIFNEHQEVEKLTLLYKQGYAEWSSLNQKLIEKTAEATSLNDALVAKTAEAISLNEALKAKTDEVTSLKKALITKTVEEKTLDEILTEKSTEIANLNESLIKKSEEVHETEILLIKLREELDQMSMAYNSIIKSTSWRLTKPLRGALDVIKKICSKSKIDKVPKLLIRTYHYWRAHGLKQTISKTVDKLSHKNIRNNRPLKFDAVACGSIEIQPISVSVVIPTYNAGQELRDLLESLSLQEGVGFMEIIIVDSGSTDETIEISRLYNTVLISITQEQFSHSYARNLGARHANGENILFMTQDALPSSKRWLSEMYRPMMCDTTIVAVSCGEKPRPDADLFGLACSWGHARFMGVLDCDRILEMPKRCTMEEIRRNANLNDVACLIKKRVFEQFEYRFNYAEDLDLGVRLIKSGHRLALRGSIKVIHSHTRPEFYYLKRAFVERKALKNIFPEEPLIHIKENDFLLGARWLYNHTMHAVKYLSSFPEENNVEDYVIKANKIFSKNIKDLPAKDILAFEPTAEFIEFIQSIDQKCNLLKAEQLSEESKAAFFTYFQGQAGMILDYLKNHIENVTRQINQAICKSLFCVCANAIGDILGYTWLTAYDKNQLLTKIYDKVGKGV